MYYQLLRYAPNRLSEEFYNIAVLLYGPQGELRDARFTPDFTRLRSNPLADLELLEALREEFEARRLSGDGFARYVEEMTRNLSQGLQASEPKFYLDGAAVEGLELERLVRVYLATPRRSEVRPVEPAPGTRRSIRAKVRETFRMYHLLDHLDPDVAVGAYVNPRFSFTVDYATRPNGSIQYFQALSLAHDVSDAFRLCSVFDRIRAVIPATMTAVVADGLPADTRELLASSRIRPWEVSRLDELALTLRAGLGLR